MELLYSEEAMDAKLDAFLGGALMGLGFGGIGSTIGYHEGNRQTKSDYGDSQLEIKAPVLTTGA